MKEELYKWYPIVDEGEYWTDHELYPYTYMRLNSEDFKDTHNLDKIATIVSDGTVLYSYEECRFGWGTMAKMGWKYMRIKIN